MGAGPHWWAELKPPTGCQLNNPDLKCCHLFEFCLSLFADLIFHFYFTVFRLFCFVHFSNIL